MRVNAGQESLDGGTLRDTPPYYGSLQTCHTGEYHCSSLGCRQVRGAEKGGKAAGTKVFDGQLGQMTLTAGQSARLIMPKGLKVVNNTW